MSKPATKEELKELLLDVIAEYASAIYDGDPERPLIEYLKENSLDEDPDEFGYRFSDYQAYTIMERLQDVFPGQSIFKDEDLFFQESVEEILDRCTESLYESDTKMPGSTSGNSRWSMRTQLTTRKVLNESIESGGTFFAVKNIRNDDAYGILKSLEEDEIVVITRKEKVQEVFSSVDELIKAGWVLD